MTTLSSSAQSGNTPPLPGSVIGLADIQPWHNPVDGNELFQAIAQCHLSYVAMPDHFADVCVLWEAHAHVFNEFMCSPRLNISAAEKRCGKTTLRDVVALFVPRPLQVESITTAALFRVIDANQPTILADEYDTWLRDNEDMRGIMNAGHRRDGKAIRCSGDHHDVRLFRVFAPAVLCGIGQLPGTLIDRSIAIRLERAKHGEVAKRFDSRHTEHEQELCRKLARWCADNREAIGECDPVLPPGAFNRVADNWRPLFAIAQVLGGDWTARANAAFSKIMAKEIEDDGAENTLLADVREIFEENGGERMWTADICDKLNAMTERPYCDMRNGGMNGHRLARALHAYQIQSRKIRDGNETKRGYFKEDFEAIWERFLSPVSPSGDQSGTPEQTP